MVKDHYESSHKVITTEPNAKSKSNAVSADIGYRKSSAIYLRLHLRPAKLPAAFER